jgi:hypothetical protein
MWVLVGTALLLIVMGVLIRNPKWYWLISGYNTMSKEKKEKVDIKGLSVFVGNMLFVMGGVFLLFVLFDYLNYPLLSLGAIGLTFPITIYMLIKAQSYDANSRNPDGSYKLHIKLLISFLVLVFTGVGTLIYFSMQPANVNITNEYLQIKGIYGKEVKWEDIESVTLEEDMPKIKARTNGSSIGEIKRGHFRLEDKRRVLLFMEDNQPPYIFIERKQGLVIINLKEREATEELYQRIIKSKK